MPLSNRRIQWISFMTGVALLCSIGLACRSVNIEPNAQLQRFEFEEPQMGVPFKIVLYAENQKIAEEAADAAFRRIAELNAIMSDYETDSEISKLSRSSEEGSPEVALSADLWAVLDPSQKLAKDSAGAFDVTVGPCVGLWRKARREKQLPDAGRLELARSKVGYENLQLDPKNRTARLAKRGMRLDVGGIAKGYASDEALRLLRTRGIHRALVAASGDLALGDSPPGAPGWRVEISGYDRSGGPAASRAFLSNCGISTSGDLFQRVEIDGVRYSHILNPFTCVGMTNHALATVIAPRDTTADALATTMTILEPGEALKLAAKYKAAVRIIQMEGERPMVYENERFRKLRVDMSP